MKNTRKREAVKAVKYQLRHDLVVVELGEYGHVSVNGHRVCVELRDSRDDRHWGPGSFDNLGGDLYVAVRTHGEAWEDGWKTVFSEEGFCVAPTKWARDAYTSYADCWLSSSEAEEFVKANEAAIAALAACGVQTEDRNLFLRLVKVASKAIEEKALQSLTAERIEDLAKEVKMHLMEEERCPKDGYAHLLARGYIDWRVIKNSNERIFFDKLIRVLLEDGLAKEEDGNIYCRPKRVDIVSDLFREAVNTAAGRQVVEI